MEDREEMILGWKMMRIGPIWGKNLIKGVVDRGEVDIARKGGNGEIKGNDNFLMILVIKGVNTGKNKFSHKL